MKAINILVAGVGGQGVLLASDVLALTGVEAGYDVKKSEVHGMAQRGGSVISHVRWAEVVHSPLVGKGEVDYLLAFEKLESLRYVEFIRPGGVILVNDHDIPPVSVSAGNDVYPDDEQVRSVLGGATPNYYLLPGLRLAEELGNHRVVNVLMVGALSAMLDIPTDLWLTAISKRVPEKYLALNQKAFWVGRETMMMKR